MIRAVFVERAAIALAGRKHRIGERPRPVILVVPRVMARADMRKAPPAGTPRISAIDPQYPVYGTPTTQSVRDNFAAAKREIEELQERVDGGTFGAAPRAAVDTERYRRRVHRKG